MDEIIPKWDPRTPAVPDALKLTREERESNEANAKIDGAPMYFDPTFNDSGTLATLTRIFTKSMRLLPSSKATTNHRNPPFVRAVRQYPHQPALTIVVATKVRQPDGDDTKCGIAVVFEETHPGGTSKQLLALRLDDELATHERGAIEGTIAAVKEIDPSREIRIVTNSLHLRNNLTRDLTSHTHRGWFDKEGLSQPYRALTQLLRGRSARMSIVYDRTSPGMSWTVGLAERAIDEQRASAPEHEEHTGPDVAGTRLTEITQGSAYHTLLTMQKIPHGRNTATNIGRIRATLAEHNGNWPKAKEIWLSIHSKDFSRPTREFLWRAIHGSQKVGSYWLQVPEKEHWSECPPCQALETMDHILLECTSPGQELVWEAARQLWGRSSMPWPDISLGIILGCGLVEIRGEGDVVLHGPTRLFRIIVTEAAFLIWKIRNERRIQNGDDPEALICEQEITSRWRAAMEKRLKIDALLTNRSNLKRKALPLRLMRATWGPIIHVPDRTKPEKWWAGPEFLVSIWPQRPRGRER